MRFDFLWRVGLFCIIARRGMKPHGYPYKGGSYPYGALSRLARFSGLRTNSMDVYVRAGIIRASNGMCVIMP